MFKEDISIVIFYAGMGTARVLDNVCGKPIIMHQLEMLKNYDDIRIVVGYQAEKVIELVNCYRQDIMYIFNYDFKTTKVASSLSKCLVGAKKYIVAIDGGLLVNPLDFSELIAYKGECLGISQPYSDNPVYVGLDEKGNVISFSKDNGLMEWSGIAKIQSTRLKPGKGTFFDILKPLLPIASFRMRSRGVDLPGDYDRGIDRGKMGCLD